MCSATAEQSAAASEELAGQSTLLKSLVDQFTISDEYGGSGSSAPGMSYSSVGADSFDFDASDKY